MELLPAAKQWHTHTRVLYLQDELADLFQRVNKDENTEKETADELLACLHVDEVNEDGFMLRGLLADKEEPVFADDNERLTNILAQVNVPHNLLELQLELGAVEVLRRGQPWLDAVGHDDHVLVTIRRVAQKHHVEKIALVHGEEVVGNAAGVELACHVCNKLARVNGSLRHQTVTAAPSLPPTEAGIPPWDQA